MQSESARSIAPEVLGVGLIGAGPVAQAIHLPTLARLRSMFRVTAVMDVDERVAATAAAPAGARSTSSVDDLLADPTVDVVVVCSPHRFHAEQLIAACRAGKRAVLCEKPLAMDLGEAEQIAAASAESGVPIIVGAMHAFDPGWTASLAAWQDRTPNHIRSSIVLPPNARFESLATELFTTPASTSQVRAGVDSVTDRLRDAILGLAIHDIPLIRMLAPSFTDVTVRKAVALAPFGYLIVLEVGDTVVELHATMSENWESSWTLEAFAVDAHLTMSFTPSYVSAGSATGALRTAEGTAIVGPFAKNGYLAEWEAVYRAALGETRPDAIPLIDDLRFALAIADGAAHVVRGSAVDREIAA